MYDIPLWSAVTGNCALRNGDREVAYFHTLLPQATNEDLEVRICADQALVDEDIEVELYVK